jgi:hypothetical protein
MLLDVHDYEMQCLQACAKNKSIFNVTATAWIRRKTSGIVYGTIPFGTTNPSK